MFTGQIVRRRLVEALPFVIVAVSPQQASVSPVLNCGSRDAEPLGYLLDCQQSEIAHPLTTVPQAIMPPDIDDCHHSEWSSHP
jgi:hypothetical protein